ncbi:hypothetical protein LEP1GSC050_1385 [Leptospira broomii serovar Hurstbridge str. 5399]|uniref:Uncharacterized protein n=1 Tax=Leptospira broomii serovar Hurstbridge str. 5399 TaxID=1049789 RepID=T0GD74_9LEPT|nr:hypothetical protein LEP1GSC050_1385 [Leptospira broomii serovar Hurstbridge str. 5399]
MTYSSQKVTMNSVKRITIFYAFVLTLSFLLSLTLPIVTINT